MGPRRRGDSVFSARGFTLIELLIVCAILGILAALVIAHLARAKMAANEASAISTLRALNSAQMAYSSSCGRNLFAPTFAQLVAGGFASDDMNLSPKSGYAFTLTPGGGAAGAPDCAAQPTQNFYYASAAPVSVASGRRGFATSVAAVVWQDTTGTPPPLPFVLGPQIGPIQ
jgi:prepilin-type N-terminal cleavage/methylation domain-containing protein